MQTMMQTDMESRREELRESCVRGLYAAQWGQPGGMPLEAVFLAAHKHHGRTDTCARQGAQNAL